MARRRTQQLGAFRYTVLPAFSVMLAVIVAAMPWGISGDATFVLPLMVVATVFVLTAGAVPLLPSWLVFAAGLITDLLTAGPLGYWAIILLLTYSFARMFSSRTRQWHWGALWTCFVVTVAVVAAVGWSLASLYFVRPIDWHPVAIGAAAAAGLFPLLLALMTRLLGLGAWRVSPV